MTKPTIGIEYVPNLKVRVYHVTKDISKYPIHDFQRPLTEDEKQNLDDVGEVGTQLIREIFNIPGVYGIIIEPYQLQVEKAILFDWEEIEPRILEALKKIFTEEEQNEISIVFSYAEAEEASQIPEYIAISLGMRSLN